jgi:hypothetical protein
VEEVLEVVDRFQMKDLMGFKYDWNAEIIAQFHATFFYDSYAYSIHWMAEGVHYKINFVTFTPNLIARMLPGAAPFSISKFI